MFEHQLYIIQHPRCVGKKEQEIVISAAKVTHLYTHNLMDLVCGVPVIVVLLFLVS